MKKVYLTPTLLNSWQYYMSSRDSLEESAKESFFSCLNKFKTEPTPDQKRGLDFEQDCYDFAQGKENLYTKDVAEIGALIKGGMFQEPLIMWLSTQKDIEIYLYGVADVIKSDTIYDIKSVKSYNPPKYNHSTQHKAYLSASNCEKFVYLISNGENVYKEEYNKSLKLTEELRTTALEFIAWLRISGYFNIYLELWGADEKLRKMELE